MDEVRRSGNEDRQSWVGTVGKARIAGSATLWISSLTGDAIAMGGIELAC